MLDKQSKAVEMSAIDATDIFRQLALPIPPGDSVKAQIRRAGNAVGLPPRRAKSLWYGACNLWADEWRKLCAAHRRHVETLQRQAQADLERYDRLLADRQFLEKQLDLNV